jgi:hypothetical protein
MFNVLYFHVITDRKEETSQTFLFDVTKFAPICWEIRNNRSGPVHSGTVCWESSYLPQKKKQPVFSHYFSVKKAVPERGSWTYTDCAFVSVFKGTLYGYSEPVCLLKLNQSSSFSLILGTRDFCMFFPSYKGKVVPVL